MSDSPQDQRPPTPPSQTKMNQNLGRYGTIGLEIFFAILLGYAAGAYIDRHLGTGPWVTIFMTLSGVGAAIQALRRMAQLYKTDVQTSRDDQTL